MTRVGDWARVCWAAAVVGLSGLAAGACSGGDKVNFSGDGTGGVDGGVSGGASSGGRSSGGTSSGGRSSGGTSSGGRGTGGASSGGAPASGGDPGTGGDTVVTDAGSGGSGAGGEPPDASPCHSCPVGTICLPSGACVECDPDGTDTCETGKYCSAEGACVRGCKATGDGCASARCDQGHECTSCLSDDECSAGHTCGTGVCHAACDAVETCGANTTCCDTRCVDTTRDRTACGDCDTACAGDDFCSPSGCVGTVVANVCELTKGTILLDGLPADDDASSVVQAALLAGCPETIPARAYDLVDQLTSPTLNPTTGRPVVGGGDLQIVLGGTYGQTLIRYLEADTGTRIYNTYDGGAVRFHERGADGGPGKILVEATPEMLTATHSYFIIETLLDPASGTSTLALYGLSGEGTTAAAYYFTHTVLPQRAAYSKAYYIYEWTGADADAGPGAGDTVTLLFSG